MGNSEIEKGPKPGFWKTAMGTLSLLRVLSVVAGAGAILLLDKDGQLIDWEPFFGGVLDTYSQLLDQILGPLEQTINRLISRLGWNLSLGPGFKPTFVVLFAFYTAEFRSVNKGRFLEWVVLLFLALLYLLISAVLGLTLTGDIWGGYSDFLYVVGMMVSIAVAPYVLPLATGRPASRFGLNVSREISAILLGVLIFIFTNYAMRMTSP